MIISFYIINNAFAIDIGYNGFYLDMSGDTINYDLNDYDNYLENDFDFVIVTEINQVTLNYITDASLYKRNVIYDANNLEYYLTYYQGVTPGTITIDLKDYNNTVIESYSLSFSSNAYFIAHIYNNSGDYYIEFKYCSNSDLRNYQDLSRINNYFNNVVIPKTYFQDNKNNIYYKFYSIDRYDLSDCLMDFWNYERDNFFIFTYNGFIYNQSKLDTYADAYRYGYLEGFKSYDNANAEIIQWNYDNGYNTGYKVGYDYAYDIGYDYGYQRGDQDGHDEYYDEGYQDGLADGDININLATLLTGSFTGVFNGMMPVLNYKFFGVSLLDFISLIGMLSVLLLVLKIFI